MVLAPSITLHINQMRMRQRGGRQVAGRQGNRLPGGLALWFRLAMVTSRIWPEPADGGKLDCADLARVGTAGHCG